MASSVEVKRARASKANANEIETNHVKNEKDDSMSALNEMLDRHKKRGKVKVACALQGRRKSK